MSKEQRKSAFVTREPVEAIRTLFIAYFLLFSLPAMTALILDRDVGPVSDGGVSAAVRVLYSRDLLLYDKGTLEPAVYEGSKEVDDTQDDNKVAHS